MLTHTHKHTRTDFCYNTNVSGGVTGERRRSRFDLGGLASGVTAIKVGGELLSALGHPLMNDMKQMCERWRRRNDGENVTAAHTLTHTHAQATHLRGVQAAPRRVHTLQIAANTCFGAQTSTASNQAEVSKRAATSKRSPT